MSRWNVTTRPAICLTCFRRCLACVSDDLLIKASSSYLEEDDSDDVIVGVVFKERGGRSAVGWWCWGEGGV